MGEVPVGWITVRQAARMLECAESAVYCLVHKRRLVPVQRGGPGVRECWDWWAQGGGEE